MQFWTHQNQRESPEDPWCKDSRCQFHGLKHFIQLESWKFFYIVKINNTFLSEPAIFWENSVAYFDARVKEIAG